jgi:hypothetical protein
MKVTIAQLIEADEAIRNLLELKLPFASSVAIGKVIDEIRDIVSQAQEARIAALEYLGKKQEDGNFFVPPDKQEELGKIFTDIYETPIELTSKSIDPVPDGLLSVKDVITLAWLWKEPEDG